MDNHTINKLLSRNKITQNRFGGVYAADTLKERERDKVKNRYYVVNLDKSNQPGSHWIAIYVAENGEDNEYFDSYGWRPHANALKFETFMNFSYIYQNRQLQHPVSTVCGQYCMFYIWCKCKGKTLQQIVDLFPQGNHFVTNDTMVNAAIEQLFKTDQEVFDKQFMSSSIMKSKNMKQVTRLYSGERGEKGA